MLIEVDSKTYNNQFPISPNPYISDGFISLNSEKVDEVVRLLENKSKVAIGLIAGIKDGILKSPFSAPFGGFHFRNDNIYVSEIELFIDELIEYAKVKCIEKIEITLPPSIYHLSFNTKLVNTLIRKGLDMEVPDITNWINLIAFNGAFTNKSAKKYYNQAIRNKLKFEILSETIDKKIAYEIICDNRKRFGRPIYMGFEDLNRINKLWAVDFFGVRDENDLFVAGGVFYRGHKSIVQGIFWGDNEEGRLLRAIDFLSLNIWNHYKNLGFEAIDLGISTEDGIPNEGLLRFKESHNCSSSLKFGFYWENDSIA